MIKNLAVAATLVVAATAVATPPAHADDLATEICERLVDENLWETTHYLSWKEHIALVPEMIPAAFRAIRTQCPQLSWRLPEPEAPAPASRPPHTGTSQPQPQEPDWYGDEPFGPREI